MQLKTIQPMHVFCFETETTMQKMMQYVRVVARRLYTESIKNDLEVTGPVYWIYEGADGNPETTFALTIAIPVSSPESSPVHPEFKVKNLEKFHCLSKQHLGNWAELGKTYGELIGEIQSRNFKMSGLTREIYLNMDFETLEGNITEVQIGLLPS
jgi:effector-binding domain-containing protein